MNVIFLGPPGSGKGTQAKRLAETQSLNHISTGDVFREAIQAESDLGLQIKNYVTAGKLVPDDLVSEVVFDKLKREKSGAGFLLDGYPRTIDQAKALDHFSQNERVALDSIVFLDVDSNELVKRLSARRQCPKCKEVYNLETRPPKTAETCDLCSTGIVQRSDDRVEVVKERLLVYSTQTEPVLDFYKVRKEFHKIDGAQDIDRVFAEITSIFQSAQGSHT